MFSIFNIFYSGFLWRRYRNCWKYGCFFHLIESYVKMSFKVSGRRWGRTSQLENAGSWKYACDSRNYIRNWLQRHYHGIVMTIYGRFFDFEKFSQIGSTVFLLALNTFHLLFYSPSHILNSWFWTDVNSSTKDCFLFVLDPRVLAL